jgi:predicted transcriptional regulator
MATCSDLMTKNPIWCVSTDSVSNAAQLMKREEVGLLPVVEEQQNKKVVGIIAQADIALHVDEPTTISDVVRKISRPTPVHPSMAITD